MSAFAVNSSVLSYRDILHLIAHSEGRVNCLVCQVGVLPRAAKAIEIRAGPSLATGVIPWSADTEALQPRVVEALRSQHYSRRTEEVYFHWIRRFISFHTGAHPRFAESGLR